MNLHRLLLLLPPCSYPFAYFYSFDIASRNHQLIDNRLTTRSAVKTIMEPPTLLRLPPITTRSPNTSSTFPYFLPLPLPLPLPPSSSSSSSSPSSPSSTRQPTPSQSHAHSQSQSSSSSSPYSPLLSRTQSHSHNRSRSESNASIISIQRPCPPLCRSRPGTPNPNINSNMNINININTNSNTNSNPTPDDNFAFLIRSPLGPSSSSSTFPSNSHFTSTHSPLIPAPIIPGIFLSTSDDEHGPVPPGTISAGTNDDDYDREEKDALKKAEEESSIAYKAWRDAEVSLKWFLDLLAWMPDRG